MSNEKSAGKITDIRALGAKKAVRPADIYEKYCNGDSLTDAEVQLAASFFRKVSDDLYKCGPVFKLAAQEASRVAMSMEGFWKARNSK